jgi:hypothetical protein
MARQQFRQCWHPRSVPIEHLSARRTGHPGSGGSARANATCTRTKAGTRAAINHDFVKLNLKIVKRRKKCAY